MIHLATRQVRVWAAPGFSAPAGLSLSADGRWLGYTVSAGARILPTGAPPGLLSVQSRTVPGGARWAALAGDGRTLYECTVSPSEPGPPSQVGSLTYGTTPVSGGREHVIASWPGVVSPGCYASLDPAGRYLVVQYPTAAHGVDGWSRPAILDLRTGRLTGIDAPAFYGPLDVAW